MTNQERWRQTYNLREGLYRQAMVKMARSLREARDRVALWRWVSLVSWATAGSVLWWGR